MGKRSDELRREIDDYRRQLDSKIDRLDERVRSDLRDSRDTVDRDVRDRLHLDKYAEERPLLTLAVAFGTGILLGSVTPEMPTPSMPSRSNGSKNNQSGSSGDSGMLSQLVGTATGALGGTIQQEIRDLIQQATGSRDAGAPGPQDFERRETPEQPSVGSRRADELPELP